MEKPSTLKKSFKQENASESPKQPNFNELNSTNSIVNEAEGFQPSDSTIDLLLNYSKALSTQETKSFGTVFNVLN